MPLLCEAYGPEAAHATTPPRAVIGTPETVLLTALSPDVALALWLREEPAGFAKPLKPLRQAGPFRATAEGTPDEALDSLCEQLPAGAPMALLSDMLRLSHMFAALLRSQHVRLRLDGITGDACRKFHVDSVGFRLLVTYAGPGTQWSMGDPDGGAQIEDVPRCAVALFRGRKRAGATTLHRSPPLSHLPEGQRSRLVFCIDEPGCC
ncbi:DUF1826 domain-containing protein [Sediminicoccus sp. KRV36]|uniref:DUF1826 domain-containing protein n=1 Tax=Sediminicoccus sp. KRV36 TaxID=3133721 RepID=UPI00200F390A|nr:DUF1826 domain-containing protein [Sediminicoccus rosea]UPY38819.1 DUF1826 domain-containing protein [Sediminicoccus rosea]